MIGLVAGPVCEAEIDPLLSDVVMPEDTVAISGEDARYLVTIEDDLAVGFVGDEVDGRVETIPGQGEQLAQGPEGVGGGDLAACESGSDTDPS